MAKYIMFIWDWRYNFKSCIQCLLLQNRTGEATMKSTWERTTEFLQFKHGEII